MYRSRNSYPTDKHGWAELLPTRHPRPALTGTQRVPWTVVGAGVTGLACARRLAELQPSQKILLLDARLVGQGASGRNSGFAVGITHFNGPFDAAQMGEYRRINRINQAGVDSLRGQVARHAIDCQWSEEGIHYAAADQLAIRERDNFMPYLEAMEIPHTPLDGEMLHERLGTGLYKTGVHVHPGVLLHPAALVHGLADSLPGNVQLYEQSPVLAINPGAPLSLELPDGTVQTDKLLLATNNEAAKLGFLRYALTGSTLSGSFTRVLDEDELAALGQLSEWGILSLHSGGATVRLTPDRRICIRNTVEYRGAALLSDAELGRRQAIHRAAFETRFPQLAHVPFEFAWSGVEGMSRNSTNFFGRQRDNFYFAGGYNGSGVSKGTAFGLALAEYAAGGQSSLIDDCLASAPAALIPPRPFLDLGALMTVRSRFRGVGLDR